MTLDWTWINVMGLNMLRSYEFMIPSKCESSLERRVSRTSSPSLPCNLESRPNEFMHLQHIVLHWIVLFSRWLCSDICNFGGYEREFLVYKSRNIQKQCHMEVFIGHSMHDETATATSSAFLFIDLEWGAHFSPTKLLPPFHHLVM